MNVPLATAVPERKPAAEKLNPAGSAIPKTDCQSRTDPSTARELLGVAHPGPSPPRSSVSGRIAIVGARTVSVYDLSALTKGPGKGLLSLALTVNVYVPADEGVPPSFLST